MNYADFIPKSVVCFFKENYTRETFFSDLFAGVSVGIIALPLALAFAIASGVPPERGLFTAVVAGFLISLLGGSRVQIGGPTGAFVVIVYAIVQKHGYEGLAVATLLAGGMLILMGLARFGVLLRFIPYSVTTGFTTGIAFVIAFSQVRDFFGLQTTHMPPEFIEKCSLYCQIAHTWNGHAVAIALTTLALIVCFRRTLPRLPGVLMAIGITALCAYFLKFPVETIESKFTEIPRMLPSPGWPSFSYDLVKRVFPDAITIALLGAIESLLSAVVADGLAGTKHRSNMELVAQGFANLGSILFGGIPATGAIARTTANIKFGAKTPLAGMIHAVTLLLLMLFFAPLAGKIPLAALAAVLIFVAWNMSELPHFFEILRGPRGDAVILVITFLLTVLIDLTVAVQVGVILGAVTFLKKMTDATELKITRDLSRENTHEPPLVNDGEILFRKDIPADVSVFEIQGPFFYSIADLLDETLYRLRPPPRVFILRVRHIPFIDATGLQALKKFHQKCQKKGILFLIADISPAQKLFFQKNSVEETLGKDHLFPTLDVALQFVKT